MNAAVTSQKELLEAAKKIALKQGISKISIRAVAQSCDISVGAIYNYFPTKSDLVVAVIEDFWLSAFRNVNWEELCHKDFILCFEAILEILSSHLLTFQQDWVDQLPLLAAQEKQMGREKEASYFQHVIAILEKSLELDAAIDQTSWSGPFSRAAFAAFAFDEMLLLLRNHQNDCAFLKQLFCRVLYCS